MYENKEGESCERHVLHRQTRELVYKLFSYFKCEADTGMPIHDVARVQEHNAEACVIDIAGVQRII
jgi:hypothetical protein